MGFNLSERLIIVLSHSWKAQVAAFVTLLATLGTFLVVKQVEHTLAQSSMN